jgi:imidazole glycerol-phosphate synthase subunit HisH
MKLGVLDYGAGNLRSVLNAFAAIGAPAQLVTRPGDFDGLDVLVFPGQGAFGDSVRILKAHGPLGAAQGLAGKAPSVPTSASASATSCCLKAARNRPSVEGLCVAPGRVRKFPSLHGLKIPHMGWNQVRWEAKAHPQHRHHRPR